MSNPNILRTRDKGVEYTRGKRASRARRWLLAGGWVICLLCWMALGAGIALDAGRVTFMVLVTAAAVATEAMFWLTALVLGLTVVQSRRAIWNWLLRRSTRE